MGLRSQTLKPRWWWQIERSGKAFNATASGRARLGLKIPKQGANSKWNGHR